ncbi:hypothetical protein RJ639_022188 [Escallonia herrerae]|uniref:Peptidase C1A papain C-terminal domain-containing protein n=1 Tax=Escallonia herrerae TaxID=1293975 RepID=A0AA88V544_9ASTE|nr:hypothetical protein RJ639_022188 [Escallonia herrerae]
MAVALLCAYELCALYVTAGNGLDVDEYVRRAYKFAYSDCIEVGPVASLSEPPDPNELYPRKSKRQALLIPFLLVLLNICFCLWASHLGLLYLGSLVVLLVYAILYGLTAKESHWLGAITSAAVIILDWNIGACLYGFQLLQSLVIALFVAGMSRVFLICFGVHYWFVPDFKAGTFIVKSDSLKKSLSHYHVVLPNRYLGHCVCYAVVASVLLGAAVSRHSSVTNPLAARRDALQSTVIRLREGFHRKEQNGSSSSSEGCGSSIKRSSSAEAGHLGNGGNCTIDTNSWNNVEGFNSEKSIDSGRPSLALHSSSSRSVVQEPEIGMSYADKNFDHNSSLVICFSSGLESRGCGSSESTSANQQALDFSLALAFQEKLNEPRITSMLKRRGRQGDIELTNLLQDKGLDPNFAVMLKENGLDPRILALLRRSSLDADRDHCDNTDMNIVDVTSLDNVLPNQISLSEELRFHGLEKWLHISRLVLHRVAVQQKNGVLVGASRWMWVAATSIHTAGIKNAYDQGVNWAEAGVVSPVRDQDDAPTCYIMAASSATESLLAMVYGRKLCLSAQEVVDCHAGHDCKKDGYATLIEGDEGMLLRAVAQQPVLARLRVGMKFCTYQGGIFYRIYDSPVDGEIGDHDVLITGYEIDRDGNIMLIVKNSWGHEWGIHGYIFLTSKEALVVAAAAECWSKMGRVYTRHPDILTSSPPRILTPADFPQKVITPEGVPEYTPDECDEWRLPVRGLAKLRRAIQFADSKEMGSKVNEYIEGGCLPLLVSPDKVLSKHDCFLRPPLVKKKEKCFSVVDDRYSCRNKMEV